jgi:hypothetical protein
LFTEFSDEEIWSEIEAKRRGGQQDGGPPEDLKMPEWGVFSNPDTAAETRDFKLKRVAPPKGFEAFFEDTVLVERIREVRALLGFTRIESNADFIEATVLNDGRLTRLCRESPKWLPASEVRGEGIFLRIRESSLLTWHGKPEVQRLEQEFFDAHKAWRRFRNLLPIQEGFPGIRLVLLHSLAHALMRQIVLDCGYTAASVRERLYSRHPGEEGGPMAGILLYTPHRTVRALSAVWSNWVSLLLSAVICNRRWKACVCVGLILFAQSIARISSAAASTVHAVMPASFPPKHPASAATVIWIARRWLILLLPAPPPFSIENCDR